MNNSAQTNDASAFAKASTDLHLIPAKPLDEDGCCVRQNRVVLASVADATPCGDASAQPGLDKSSIREATVTKRIRRRGERGISRQPIAQGMPECSGCTCMLVCALPCAHCTRDRGCSKHPAFPAPSQEGQGSSKPRALCAARTRSHIQSSSPAHAGDPVFQRCQ